MRHLIALLMTALLSAPAAVQADENSKRAVETTQTMLSSAHQALTSGANGQALRRAISDGFQLDLWARFLLQGREDQLDNGQADRFRALLPGFLAHLYAAQFELGLDSPPQIGDVRPARRGDVLVQSTFPRNNGNSLPVAWRVRSFPDSGARIIDVMVGGTSFLILKQEEFRSIIDNNGIDALLTHMQRNSR